MTAARDEGNGELVRPVRSLGLPARILLGLLLVVGAALGAPGGFGLYFFVPYASVGALVAIRRPRQSIGWILLAIGLGFATVTVTVNATPEQFAAASVDPVTAGIAVVSASMGAVLFLLFAVLAMVFPSGRLPAGRSRVLALGALAIGLAAIALGAAMPVISVNVWGEAASIPVRNPAALLPDMAIWQVVTPDNAILPIVGILVASVVALLARFRRATGVERQQLRWITAALAFVVAAVLGGFVASLLSPEAAASGLVWLGAIVAFPCVPIAVGVAVLRYRLYEIDRIVSRTIGWAVVTAILAAVFAALIVGLQTVLASVTEGGTLAVAASTLGAAALFQPVRGRVQRMVDRRFNRSRVDAARIVASFASRARDEVDLGNLGGAVVGTARQAVGPSFAGMWLKGGR